MNNDYHAINISDIWSFELDLFLEGKVSETHLGELFQRIEDVIIEKGKPFLSTKDYDVGSEEYRQNFVSRINDFRDSIGDYQARYTLNYFFTNEHAYYYNQSIMIDNGYDDFDFWFTCKLRQFDSKLIALNKFLDFQLKSNFNNDLFSYTRFLSAIVIQYKKDLLSVKLIEGVNQWINEYKSDSDIHDQRKLKGEYSSLRLRELSSNPKYFQENSQALDAVLKQLKDNDFIHSNTLFIDFKRILKASNIPKNKRIVWTGTNKDLQWFMKYLTKESNKIKYHKDDIWLVASKCFVDKQGKEFTTDSLRKANGNNWQRKKLLESIIRKI